VRRIVANLFWEEGLGENDHAHRRASPSRTALATASALGTLLRAFAQEGDHLWTPAPVDPARVLEVPGLPRPLLESGPLERLPPADEVLEWGATSPVSANIAAAVHHRAFCLELARELGCALPGAAMLASPAELDRHLASPGAPPSWVLKAPLSASGRDRHIERAGPGLSTPKARRTVERLFERHGPLLFEPWMDRTADFGVSAILTEASLQIVGIHGQLVDVKGQFAGIDLQPRLAAPERERLLATVEAVAGALRRAGYLGPFGIDAWRYRRQDTEILHPLGEINARRTFGLVAWTFGQRLPGTRRLLLGRALPAPDSGILPLLAPGPQNGPAAWLERI
jgi:hypothetical protein